MSRPQASESSEVPPASILPPVPHAWHLLYRFCRVHVECS